MKKILKILLVVILLVLGALVVTPLLFKRQILDKAKEIANASVNAKIDFADLKLTFFKDFPRLTTSLYGVSVAGTEAFEADTLLAFEEFSATVNLLSLVKKEAIRVRSIWLDHPRISAVVLEDGSANWDIAKASKDDELPEEKEDEDSGTMDLKVDLKKFEIRDAYMAYQDRVSGLEASMEGFDFLLSGDLAQDFTSLDMSATTRKLNLVMGGIRYIRDAMLDIGINLDADMVNGEFTFKDNFLALNDLVLQLDGKVSLPEGGDMGMNIDFNTRETSFKSLLSMVPAVYMRDFQDVRTDGELALSGKIQGSFTEEHTPSADVKLRVENASFEYPDLPKSAERIHMDVDIHYDGIQHDNSLVDVNDFHVELGDNPVDLTLHLATPISDPKVNATVAARIDFSTLADVVPMEDVSLTGTLEASIDLMGEMSSLEDERYDEFRADGSLKLQQFEMRSPGIPQPVFINRTVMQFSPQYLELAELDAKIGSSDVKMDGKLENFLPYLFQDGQISGRLNLQSRLLDLNEFMPEEAGDEEAVTGPEVAQAGDTLAPEVIEIPGNIDFVFTSSLQKVLFNKLEADNLIGLIIIRDQRVIMQELSMDLLKGKVVMSGEYNTQDLKSPLVDLSLDVNRIDIPSAFTSLVTVQKLAPIAAQTIGTVSTNLAFTSFLGRGMMPVMNSIVASGKLSSEQLTIQKTETFDRINEWLKADKFRDVTMKDLAIEYAVRNGRVYIQPYQTRIGNTTLVMGGDQGLDQTMNYEMKMKIPRTDLGGTAQDALNQITSLAASQGIDMDPGETIDVMFLVTGTFTEPVIRPVFEKGLSDVTDQVRGQVQEMVEEKVEEVEQEIRDEASKEAERILAEAQARADALKAEAKTAGEELIRLAEEEGQKRIKEAGNNPIQKVAAETYARTLKTEAEKNAKKLEDEANKQADEIMRQAREQAEKLK